MTPAFDKCTCQIEDCKTGHAPGACQGPATTRTAWKRIALCNECKRFLPLRFHRGPLSMTEHIELPDEIAAVIVDLIDERDPNVQTAVARAVTVTLAYAGRLAVDISRAYAEDEPVAYAKELAHKIGADIEHAIIHGLPAIKPAPPTAPAETTPA